MNQEKRIHKFDYVWQADAVAAELSQHGIESRVVGRPREYVNVVIGGSQSPVDLFVQAQDEERALAVLTQFFREREISVAPESQPVESGKDDFRAVIGYNLLSFLLPFVFTLFSLLPYFRLIRSSQSATRKWLATAFVGLGLWLSSKMATLVFEPWFF